MKRDTDSHSRLIVATLVLAVIASLAGGVWFFRSQQQVMRNEIEKNLGAIARIKADQIVAWRKDQLADAAMHAHPFMLESVTRFLSEPTENNRRDLLTRFRALAQQHDYADVLLAGSDGKTRLRLSDSETLHHGYLSALDTALRERKPVFVDLHVEKDDRTPHISVVVPLWAANGKTQKPLGALVFITNASQFLFPLIQSWPIPSDTAETLLVRRDGDHVLFLNNLRHRPGTALNLRISQSRTDLPAVMAVKGEKGFVLGKDYRGSDVAAVILPIPESPWFMVSKIDAEEAFADWRSRSFLLLVMIFGWTALVGVVGLVFWQRAKKVHFRSLYRFEADLRAQMERHSVTLKAVGDAVIATDTQGCVELLNPVAESLTGWRQDDAGGKAIEEVFHIINARTRERAENPVARVLREGLVVGLANHTILISRDGTEYQIADSAAPITDSAGNISGVVMVFRDVTREYAMQQALRDAERYYRSLIHSLHEDILVIDGDYRVTDINNSALQTLGLNREQALGRHCYELSHSLDAPCHMHGENCGLRHVLETGAGCNLHHEHVDADGNRHHVDILTSPLKDQNGNITHVIEAVRDVTDLFESRKATDKAENALIESEKRYRMLFESAKDGILILDAGTGKIVDVNPFLSQLLGCRQDELLGKHLWELSPFATIAASKDAFETLKHKEYIRYDHLPLETAGGRIVEVEFISNVYLVDHVKVIQCNIRDNTERRQAEKALKESERHLRSTLDGLSAHIAVIDESGEIILTNKAYRDFGARNGVEPGAVSEGINYLAVCDTASGGHSQEAAPFAEGIRKVLSGKLSSFELEYPCHSPDEKRWFVGRVTPIHDEGARRVVIAHENITERKQATEAQRHSNEMMQYIIEHTNSAVAVHDRDLHYMYISKRYLKDYGVQEQDIIGKHHYDVFPDLPEKWRKVHRKALAGEVSSSERDPYERADGTVEWTRWECRPWYEANGSIGGIIVYTEVITERVQAEEALRKSEQRHRILFEEALNPILLVDENGHYVDANDAALQFMECDRKKLMGRSVWDFAPPGIIEHQKQEHSPFLKRRTLETDYMIHGRIKTLLLNVVPLEVGGRTVLCGIGQDITERKQAEEALARQQRSIKLSSQIASVFLTSSRNEVFAEVLDVLLKALDSRFGYFGYIDEAGDLVCPSMTREVWDQCQVAEKSIVFSRADWGGLWGRSLMEKQTLVANENLRIPEGHVALENALATPIVHHNKLIGQFVVADKAGGYDIDDRDLLESVAAQTAPILFAIQEEARQKTANEKLEEQMHQAQKMEAVGRLAGGVAHDFNNMLGIILGHADMILEEMDPDQAFYADLMEIRKAGERSADLTRQLLAFARKQTVAPKVIDLNKTVEGMLKMLQRLIGEDIDMAWIPGEKVWPVKIDPAQIDQVLANLCVNARDAIADVGKVTIETGNSVFDEEYCKEHAGFVPGEYTLLTVSDNGCGMNSETLENIFEPFFTTKESDKGTGLGLATVYGVVKQNNGFINVYSEPGKGTTFRIYLPRHRVKEASLPDKEAIRPAARGHETILLVEDEPAILRMTTMMLERTGYKVLAAGTPGEAIALAREHAGDIHLLMTDVVMPEMNGRDLAKNLLSLYPDLKRLFMSGYTANVIAHHGVLDEGVQFIQKPFAKQDLAVKVREVLDEAK